MDSKTEDMMFNGFYNLAIMQAIKNISNTYMYDLSERESFMLFVNNLQKHMEPGEA
jgi:hypothetical protein